MDTRFSSSQFKKVASSDGVKVERSRSVTFWHWVYYACLSSFLSINCGAMMGVVGNIILYDKDLNLSIAKSIFIGILTVLLVGLLVSVGCWPFYVAALLFMQHLPEVTKKIKSAWDNLKYHNAVCAAVCCCCLLLSVIFLYLLNEASKIINKNDQGALHYFVHSAPCSIGFVNSLSVAAFCLGRRRFISSIDRCLYGSKDAPKLDVVEPVEHLVSNRV
ncbi:hypothetical protein COLO4_25566 [Corchorus olitorius]|uniref:Uncharacterized protein n=1 Tax=Corchorus olitorius TaxID=93759 RepID=A0A1R3I1I5_9ROSI|nr:hypothetical protein COLO4_25566 [Corchorus olitorius]